MSSLDTKGNTIEDGFRKRRKRPKGWRAKAIKDGVIPDPDNPTPEPVYGENVRVFNVPSATISGKGEKL